MADVVVVVKPIEDFIVWSNVMGYIITIRESECFLPSELCFAILGAH